MSNKQQKINPLDIVKKNAEKVAQIIKALSNNDGPQFYTQKIDDATNPKLLQSAMDIVVEKTGDKFCIMLLSCCDNNVYVCAHIPNNVWANSQHGVHNWVMNTVNLDVGWEVKLVDRTCCHGKITNCGDSTPFKLIDQLIHSSVNFLRKEGFLPDEESDDENYADQFDW